MEKERFLRLTSAVYRVTAIFPIGKEGDNLCLKIRQLADKILAKPSSDKIEDILKILDQAEKENWVDPRNFLVLKREYEEIRQSIGIGHSTRLMINNNTESSVILADSSNGNRQDKIVEAINGGGMIKIGDILKVLPGVNRRTVLRDLDKLCQTGVTVRNGNGRGVYYAKNGHKCDMSQEMSQ